MAFSFSNSAGDTTAMEAGPDLPDVYAEDVGFKGVSGDSNVRLLPTPWPEDALPAPTSTLLAVASTKGLIVGAGPDCLSIASCDSVRKAISAPTDAKVKTKPFQSQATIPLPARPTHVAFASGDSALVVTTEAGSQLLVYETDSLLTGNAQPALSIPVSGAPFRAIAPNPALPDDNESSLLALVTSNGELLIANLKAGELLTGANGQVMKSGVSSVCWSNKGKQLVAGLADGTAHQITPTGDQKATIPRPADLEGECHVSSISWLENDLFLMIYTPNAAEDETGQTPPSSYYIITRRKQAPFLIQKLPELCLPFGCKRTPAYQFIARLRNYEPDLKDVLILSSTASTDVGLITRSSKPLSSDEDAKKTTDVFTTTEVSDDTKRASLPLTDSSEDTSVIGLGMDLSSTDMVIAPIQGEDIAESSTPLPNLFVLNNEGILASWWFIYSEAIRKQLPYHGQGTGSKAEVQPQSQPQPMRPEAPKQSAFGQSAFGQPAFGQSSFGSPSGSAFGKASTGPSFGSPSAIGGRSQPSFGAPSLPGAPSFGAPSQMGASFGAPSALGQRGAAQFGKSSFGSSTPAPFGQASTTGNANSSLPFASSGAPAGGGFGSFANSGSGGFGAFAASKPAGESPFSKPAGESPFAKASTESPFAKASTASPFGKPTNESPFGKPVAENPFGKPSAPSPFGGLTNTNNTSFSSQKTEETKSTFGLGSSGFVLGSTMKGDGSAANDGPKPDKPSGGLFSLGASMDDMVSSPNKPSTPAESMDDAEDAPAAPAAQEEKPETKQPAPSLFGGSSFGSQSQPSQPFGSSQTNKSPFSLFGNTEKKSSPLSPQSEQTVTPSKPKDEPDAQGSPAASMAEPPLPPDPTSKAVYGPGDTSASSNVSKSSVDDAPLPPDFTIPPKSKPASSLFGGEPPLPPDFTQKPKESEKPEEAPLPPDPATSKSAETPTKDEPGPVPDGSDADESEKEGESDFEDSGEEITHEDEEEEEEEGEDEEDTKETPPATKKTPESSFESQFSTTSSTEGLFSRIQKPAQKTQQPPRSLFGAATQPLLPPASRAHHESPRSPSPVRNGTRKSTSEQPPGSALAARKAELARYAVEEQLRLQAQEEKERKAREKQRQQEQEEAEALSEDDEEEKLRADLASALEPVPTLDPFLPHQDYAGQPSRPGIPGQIERLYHDINSMVDTLGINARSLSCFLLYQKSSADSDWIEKLQGEYPSESLDEKLRLSEIEKFDNAVLKLSALLEKHRLQGVDQKLEACHALLSKEIITLRTQCASIQKTLDAHTDAAAIVSAPLSAEQLALQQDLRKTSTDIQAKLADLESAVSLLRARIADAPRDGASRPSKRPTVEAVTSTISTMMNMAESKRSDIDVLEAQLKKLGIDTAASPGSREGSPFTTPRKGKNILPTTPGSTASRDGPVSSYHTPESAGRGINFRSSVNGSARASRLRNVNGVNDLVSKTETVQWKVKSQRRQHLVGSLKKAIDEKKVKVRSADDM
ncbi:hypothetical protein P170DRAFT_452952 [Aspergillus steynii IBT 23096]|uniref:Nucleoporin Nup159/Nup146 N-terminal domain-containing protein n=1 Tax=Aspergillus steynii IBT 23096 TaxID=1392250 RepID=A0A2I2GRY3_9EURO|nr:uncharacterized protein P170DRAFT_452952 [Aspergillus steynii IBT 23096]PLB55639.1 hypothetical protein P170DRAFT_452952 [Aspergillus steynii IBT 23096]